MSLKREKSRERSFLRRLFRKSSRVEQKRTGGAGGACCESETRSREYSNDDDIDAGATVNSATIPAWATQTRAVSRQPSHVPLIIAANRSYLTNQTPPSSPGQYPRQFHTFCSNISPSREDKRRHLATPTNGHDYCEPYHWLGPLMVPPVSPAGRSGPAVSGVLTAHHNTRPV